MVAREVWALIVTLGQAKVDTHNGFSSGGVVGGENSRARSLERTMDNEIWLLVGAVPHEGSKVAS
jgi:hypothetical protein